MRVISRADRPASRAAASMRRCTAASLSEEAERLSVTEGSNVKHGIAVEYGSIDAHAFHGRSARRLHAYGTSGAATYGTGHEFFERDLTGHTKSSGKFGGGLEHGRGAARKDFDFAQRLFVERG